MKYLPTILASFAAFLVGWAINDAAGPAPESQFTVAEMADASAALAGKRAFVSEGCVLCHQVNGVGGRIGPNLDIDDAGAALAPMDFAARIWRGAPLMVAMQETEFGYQIDLEGDEIRALAAFAADAQAQAGFGLEDVPLPMRDQFIDEVTWDRDLEDRLGGEEWTDYDEEYYEKFEDREYAPE